jgi:hypothetical protein
MKRTPAKEHHFKDAGKQLAFLSDDSRTILRSLFSHEKFTASRIPNNIARLSTARVQQLLDGELSNTPLVRKGETDDPGQGLRVSWEIVPAYKKALDVLLYSDPSS